MYDTQEISNRIKNRAKSCGVSMKVMLSDLGLGINLISQISKGQNISSINLAKIADYLNCSVDYLLGRTDQPSYTASITGDKNVIQQGSINNSPVNFNTNAQLNEIETELINILRTFTVKQKMKLLNYAYDIKENDIK